MNNLLLFCRQAFAFFRRDLFEAVSYRFHLTFTVVDMFLGALTYGFLGRAAREAMSETLLQEYGTDYLGFLVVGMAVNQFVVFSLEAPRRAIHPWNLEYLLLTPVRLPAVVIGSCCQHYAWNALHVSFYLGVGFAFFGLRLNLSSWSCLLSVLAGFAMMWGLGMISAGVQILTKKWDPVTWSLSALSLLFSGVLFPISALQPAILQKISMVLPQTHILRLVRLSTLRGASVSELGPDLLILTVAASGLFVLGLLTLRLGIARAKRLGVLGHF
ncbi:MAG: ABC transporter permease [Planctomycetes bacterium]|nr:ABC transporter permease [Planctomycetota bacterium]